MLQLFAQHTCVWYCSFRLGHELYEANLEISRGLQGGVSSDGRAVHQLWSLKILLYLPDTATKTKLELTMLTT